jgi:ABC-2 type transport system permease protein
MNPSRRIAVVGRRDLAELRSSPALVILLVAFAMVAVGVCVGAGLLLHNVQLQTTGLEKPVADRVATDVIGGLLLENVLYALTMLPFPLMIWAFAGSFVMREKLSGNLETLLATPLSLRELWLGKTLALGLVATGIGLGYALLSWLVSQIIVSVGLSHLVVVLSAPAVVAAAVLNPLFFSGMCALVILIALAKDADAAIVPSFVLGMGPMIGIPAGIGTGVLRIGSWSFCLYQALAAVVLWAVVILLLSFWRKERVVLSARQ